MLGFSALLSTTIYVLLGFALNSFLVNHDYTKNNEALIMYLVMGLFFLSYRYTVLVNIIRTIKTTFDEVFKEQLKKELVNKGEVK